MCVCTLPLDLCGQLACAAHNTGFKLAQDAFRDRLLKLGNNTFLDRIRQIISLRLDVRTALQMKQYNLPKFSPPSYGSWSLIAKVL